MFYQRSHWFALTFGVAAVMLWTRFEIYGLAGVIGIIVALLVGSILGGLVWSGLNYLSGDWFEFTKAVPGLLLGLFLGAMGGLLLEASETLPGSLFYVIMAAGLSGLVIGLVLDSRHSR